MTSALDPRVAKCERCGCDWYHPCLVDSTTKPPRGCAWNQKAWAEGHAICTVCQPVDVEVTEILDYTHGLSPLRLSLADALGMAADFKADHYQETHLSKVVRATPVPGSPEGTVTGWWISFVDGLSFYIPPDSPVEPKVGDQCILFGKGAFSTVRGVLLNGQKVFYRTEAQQVAADRAALEARQQEQKATAEACKEQTALRIAALSPPMQRRIQKFRDTNPNFDWEYLPYELMCCEQGEQLAANIRGRILDDSKYLLALEAFREAGVEEQLRLFPQLDRGHSGNSFGFACLLARYVLAGEDDLIVAQHGALTPLVGCRDYGCPHPNSDDSDESEEEGAVSPTAAS
jgi:hypothetical protein